jgi:hypothetical protein
LTLLSIKDKNYLIENSFFQKLKLLIQSSLKTMDYSGIRQDHSEKLLTLLAKNCFLDGKINTNEIDFLYDLMVRSGHSKQQIKEFESRMKSEIHKKFEFPFVLKYRKIK